MREKLFLSILIFALGCSNSRGENFAGSGTLEATEVELSALLPGQVKSVLVDEGDMVREGETVLILNTELLELQKAQLEKGILEIDYAEKQAEEGVNQARIALEAIEKNYRHIRNLYNKKVATQNQLDEITAQYNSAKSRLKYAQLALESVDAKRNTLMAQLDLLNRQLKDGVVKSPIDGIVLERFVEPGEAVRQGQVVVSIADLSVLKLKIYLVAKDIGRVKLGDKMDVKVDAFPDKVFSGKVIWIADRAEFTPKNVETKDARAELVYALKLEIENPESMLKIGMPADAFFK